MKRNYLFWIPAALFAIFLAACGGGGTGTSSSTGTAQIALTDAPGSGFDNVFLTVDEIWFHADNTVGPDDAGWLRYRLPVPQGVDLARLTNGAMSPMILNQALPAGLYRQIRILLLSNEDAVEHPEHHPYNNAVVVTDNGVTTRYPLDIPETHAEDDLTAMRENRGIPVFGSFQVPSGGTLRLAIDFDIGHDVVKVMRNGQAGYMLKPRPRAIDRENVGSISGRIDNVAVGTGHVVFAQQRNADNTFRVVRRSAVVEPSGSFLLAFLEPGTYNVLLRGSGVETLILKDVPVTRNTTTDLPTALHVTAGVEYEVNVSVRPTGAWVTFYQTLPGAGEVPYEVLSRDVDPFTGSFHDPIFLSAGRLHVGTYANNLLGIGCSPVTPLEGNGGFVVSADADLFARKYYPFSDNVASATVITAADNGATLAFTGRLPVKSPPSVAGGNSISGMMSVPGWTPDNVVIDNVVLFAVRGGMIVDSLFVDGPFATSPSAPYTMGNLPGGTATAPLPEAIYGIEAFGFGPFDTAVGMPRMADLRMGNVYGADFAFEPMGMPSLFLANLPAYEFSIISSTARMVPIKKYGQWSGVQVLHYRV